MHGGKRSYPVFDVVDSTECEEILVSVGLKFPIHSHQTVEDIVIAPKAKYRE